MPILKKPKIVHWTRHSRDKMRFYGLSEARLKRVIHSPQRIEEGIAPGTVAMMQSAGSAKHPSEIWLMIQDVPTQSGRGFEAGVSGRLSHGIAGSRSAGKTRKVISAWRYPGKTKPRSEIALDIFRREYNEYSIT